jgi:hypothetical protein
MIPLTLNITSLTIAQLKHLRHNRTAKSRQPELKPCCGFRIDPPWPVEGALPESCFCARQCWCRSCAIVSEVTFKSFVQGGEALRFLQLSVAALQIMHLQGGARGVVRETMKGGKSK